MRWFSHRRSRAGEDRSRRNLTEAAFNMHCRHSVTPGGHTMESSAAACRVMISAHASPYHALSKGWLNSFSFFVPSALDLWFELGRDCCTMHLTAKFHHPMFSRSEVIVRTNTQTNWQTNRHRWKHPPRFATLWQNKGQIKPLTRSQKKYIVQVWS